MKESVGATEGYSRLLLQDVLPFLPLQLDPYAGYSAGWVGTRHGWAHGPVVGLRFTLMNRLSMVVEGKYRWPSSPEALDEWGQINSYFTWQFFP